MFWALADLMNADAGNCINVDHSELRQLVVLFIKSNSTCYAEDTQPPTVNDMEENGTHGGDREISAFVAMTGSTVTVINSKGPNYTRRIEPLPDDTRWTQFAPWNKKHVYTHKKEFIIGNYDNVHFTSSQEDTTSPHVPVWVDFRPPFPGPQQQHRPWSHHHPH